MTLNRLLNAVCRAAFIAVLYALVAYCLSRSPFWPGALGAFLGSFVVDMLRVSFSRKA